MITFGSSAWLATEIPQHVSFELTEYRHQFRKAPRTNVEAVGLCAKYGNTIGITTIGEKSLNDFACHLRRRKY